MSVSSSRFEILTDEGLPTGRHASAQEAHENGLMHMCVHVWGVTPGGLMLQQYRSSKKTTLPDCWDPISVAKHVQFGKTPRQAAIDGAIKELRWAIPEGLLTQFDVAGKRFSFATDVRPAGWRSLHRTVSINFAVLLPDLAPQDLDAVFSFSRDEIQEVRLYPLDKFADDVSSGGEALAQYTVRPPDTLALYESAVVALRRQLESA